MHLRTDRRLCAVALIACLAVAAAPGRASAGQSQIASPKREKPTPSDISRALDIIKTDPNLTPERTFKTLRWRDQGKKPAGGLPSWLRWIVGLFEWLGQSARLLVWAAAAVLAGMLVVAIVRMVREHAVVERDEPFVAPTHVRDLDIRPETLPADVGAAARMLWDSGQQRACLALLYRGLLSRLVHVHRVAIRDSSTEGDCLLLAARHLTGSTRDYTSRLIGVWQRAVYAHEEVGTATVHAMCAEFAPALDPADGAPMVMRATA